MKRVLLGLLFAIACGTSVIRVASGQFAAPTGLAVASAGDRDVLFIANEGRDNLRALQICSGPLLPDGGPAPTTCPASQDFQFVPAPIRVFPGTVEVADRPRRLAGLRLSRADQTNTGGVLAVGADSTVRVVDARDLVEATGGKARPALSLDLPAPAVDVVAENPIDPASGLEINAPAGQTATAFVATVPQGTTPAQLLLLQVGLDDQGLVAKPVIAGKCALGAVLPRKLAVVPGGGDRVYIADGKGDGVAVVAKSSIPAPAEPPPACALDRIPAAGRSVQSVSVSPAFVDDTGAAHRAGDLIMMVLAKLPGSQGGSELDPGGVLIARASDKTVVPIPPFSLFDATAGLQAMEPLRPPALPREVAFLRATPPDPASCPLAAPPGSTPGACTQVSVGGTPAVAKFNLVAAVTSSNGQTYFVDVLNRRFINTSFYAVTEQVPSFINSPVLSPASSDPNPPQLSVIDFTAGVTASSSWRVIFQAPFPGLETRGGTLTASGRGTLLLKLPAVNVAAWTADPALQLGAGDAVSFSSFTAPAGAPQACSDLAATESQAASRYELRIAGFPAADTLELSPAEFTPAAPAGTGRSLDVSPCPSGIGTVAAVRVLADRPWLIYEGAIARARMKTGQTLTLPGRRFDYPLKYGTDAPPLAATDIALGLQLSGNDPTALGVGFSFSIRSGVDAQSFGDITQGQGFATVVTSYSSPRHPLLVFSSLTGGNAVVQADPSQLPPQFFGVVSYK